MLEKYPAPLPKESFLLLQYYFHPSWRDQSQAENMTLSFWLLAYLFYVLISLPSPLSHQFSTTGTTYSSFVHRLAQWAPSPESGFWAPPTHGSVQVAPSSHNPPLPPWSSWTTPPGTVLKSWAPLKRNCCLSAGASSMDARTDEALPAWSGPNCHWHVLLAGVKVRGLPPHISGLSSKLLWTPYIRSQPVISILWYHYSWILLWRLLIDS